MSSSHVNNGVNARPTVTAVAASSAVLRDASLGLVQALETGRVTGTATVPMVVSAATELVLSTGITEVVVRGALAGARVKTTRFIWGAGHVL